MFMNVEGEDRKHELQKQWIYYISNAKEKKFKSGFCVLIFCPQLIPLCQVIFSLKNSTFSLIQIKLFLAYLQFAYI